MPLPQPLASPSECTPTATASGGVTQSGFPVLRQPRVSGTRSGSSPAAITAGNRYWMAILGTGSGILRFRDRNPGSCASEASAQSNLTILPGSWTTGTLSTDCPLSSYGLSVLSSQPVLSASPATLAFTATQGGANPVPASVFSVECGRRHFSTSLSPANASWLLVSPASGTAPQTLQVSPDVSD